jgi:hypothetical protein
MIMAEIIHTRCPDEADWMALLSEHRRMAVLKEQRRHQRDKSDLPLLEMTSILDKGDIVKKLLNLDDTFPSDLAELHKLRNKVAHGSQFGNKKVPVLPFINMISTMDRWITELGGYYREK